MCGWDGTVKILSFGISSAGKFLQHSSGAISPVWHYMSPEQIRGDATDGRSNLYSLGAMFYEMVTERKAFDRDDVEELKQSILESMPVAPAHVNPKIHPLLSDLIMKALAKDPAQRYQNGRELLDDLEKCKESKPSAAKKAEPPKGIVAPDKAKSRRAVQVCGRQCSETCIAGDGQAGSNIRRVASLGYGLCVAIGAEKNRGAFGNDKRRFIEVSSSGFEAGCAESGRSGRRCRSSRLHRALTWR